MDSPVSGLFRSPLCLWDSPVLVHMVVFSSFLLLCGVSFIHSYADAILIP